ncbi:hypothetical protein BC831DRAFT_509847 [Entophlyctis helioformis]|nr:hypothetical protein BC831DRAFT_509847 [Entophlyctis helioformis]
MPPHTSQASQASSQTVRGFLHSSYGGHPADGVSASGLLVDAHCSLSLCAVSGRVHSIHNEDDDDDDEDDEAVQCGQRGVSPLARFDRFDRFDPDAFRCPTSQPCRPTPSASASASVHDPAVLPTRRSLSLPLLPAAMLSGPSDAGAHRTGCHQSTRGGPGARTSTATAAPGHLPMYSEPWSSGWRRGVAGHALSPLMSPLMSPLLDMRAGLLAGSEANEASDEKNEVHVQPRVDDDVLRRLWDTSPVSEACADDADDAGCTGGTDDIDGLLAAGSSPDIVTASARRVYGPIGGSPSDDDDDNDNNGGTANAGDDMRVARVEQASSPLFAQSPRVDTAAAAAALTLKTPCRTPLGRRGAVAADRDDRDDRHDDRDDRVGGRAPRRVSFVAPAVGVPTPPQQPQQQQPQEQQQKQHRLRQAFWTASNNRIYEATHCAPVTQRNAVPPAASPFIPAKRSAATHAPSPLLAFIASPVKQQPTQQPIQQPAAGKRSLGKTSRMEFPADPIDEFDDSDHGRGAKRAAVGGGVPWDTVSPLRRKFVRPVLQIRRGGSS